MMTLRELLERPFPLHHIQWRVGATSRDKSTCIPLAYIDARDVMHRLDDVVGPMNWQCRYTLADSGLLVCEIGINSAYDSGEIDTWIWKANGAGDTQVEAEKGKCSDAFKRAAVLWGIGRYLYALPNKWVKLTDGRLDQGTIAMLGETMPVWATPEGYDAIIAKRKAA